jgi:hypothetical protein
MGYYGSGSFSSPISVSGRDPTYKITRCHRQTVNVVITAYVPNYWGDKIDEYKIGGEGSTIGIER